jgi:methionyl-tRNA formyltransferase
VNAVESPSAIFFGTPEFAVPCLRALCEVASVKLVVTQPDRPAGRGMKLSPPPVKVLAQERGIEVIQPTAVRKPELAERLRALQADVAVVVAYGRILPKPVLDAPRLGCVNVHASLLPKLRGAAPIQWSILRGETRTGVCLMRMDEGMDTGPVLATRALEIGSDERAGELSQRLSALGAELLRAELPRYLRGELSAVSQDHPHATLAPLLTKEHGRVDFRLGADELHALVRGTYPWPGAFAFLDGQRIKLHRAHVLLHEGVHGEAGSVLRADRHGVEVACGRGVLVIDELQPDGKRVMSAEQFCAGLRSEGPMRFAVAP